MATTYTFGTFGDECKLTRSEFLTKCQEFQIHTFAPDDDDAKALNVNSPECEIGCRTDSGVCWAQFDNNDRLCSLATYSDSYNGGAAYELGDTFNFPVVSEHDEGFSKYNFGVDITTTTPHTTRNGWNFYLKDGWLLPHHIESGEAGYYDHLGRKLESLTTEEDWTEFLQELEEECC